MENGIDLRNTNHRFNFDGIEDNNNDMYEENKQNNENNLSLSDGRNNDEDDSNSFNMEHLITEENVDNESLNKDRSRLCYVCDASKIDFFFDCGNGLCKECVLEHLKSQIEKYKVKVFSDKIKFICAGSCKCPVDTSHMELLMDSNIKRIYHEVLFKMYLSKTSDILSCPVSSCPNYGFYNKRCNCLECNACGYKWKEGKTDIEDMINNFFSSFSYNNIRTQIKKYLITKHCNNCNTPIEKNEGCVHMECNRCEYSFCWRCTGDWSKHTEYACMGIFTNEWDESYRPDFISIILCFIVLLITLKFIFTFTVVFYLFYLLFKLALFIGGLFANVACVFNAFRQRLRYGNKNKYYLILFFLFVVELIIHMLKLHPYSDKWYLYLQLVSITAIIILGFTTKRFYR